MSERVKIAATVAFVLVWSVALCIYRDPWINLPGLSRLVCTVSGGQWYGADAIQPAACYKAGTP